MCGYMNHNVNVKVKPFGLPADCPYEWVAPQAPEQGENTSEAPAAHFDLTANATSNYASESQRVKDRQGKVRAKNPKSFEAQKSRFKPNDPNQPRIDHWMNSSASQAPLNHVVVTSPTVDDDDEVDDEDDGEVEVFDEDDIPLVRLLTNRTNNHRS